jgi:hypothetical protein
MWFHRVTLLVVIYLALDFANPMMPGAVQLVEGSIEMVAGCQARTAQDPTPVVTALPRYLSTIVPEREPTLSPARIGSASPPAPLLFRFRAPLEPRSTPASSSDDD